VHSATFEVYYSGSHFDIEIIIVNDLINWWFFTTRFGSAKDDERIKNNWYEINEGAALARKSGSQCKCPEIISSHADADDWSWKGLKKTWSHYVTWCRYCSRKPMGPKAPDSLGLTKQKYLMVPIKHKLITAPIRKWSFSRPLASMFSVVVMWGRIYRSESFGYARSEIIGCKVLGHWRSDI
jgi:hypothetical protein